MNISNDVKQWQQHVAVAFPSHPEALMEEISKHFCRNNNLIIKGREV